MRSFVFDIYHLIDLGSPLPILIGWFTDYTEGAELVDAVLDVVRKEAEGTDCLQGKLHSSLFVFVS